MRLELPPIMISPHIVKIDDGKFVNLALVVSAEFKEAKTQTVPGPVTGERFGAPRPIMVETTEQASLSVQFIGSKETFRGKPAEEFKKQLDAQAEAAANPSRR